MNFKITFKTWYKFAKIKLKEEKRNNGESISDDLSNNDQ